MRHVRSKNRKLNLDKFQVINKIADGNVLTELSMN